MGRCCVHGILVSLICREASAAGQGRGRFARSCMGRTTMAGWRCPHDTSYRAVAKAAGPRSNRARRAFFLFFRKGTADFQEFRLESRLVFFTCLRYASCYYGNQREWKCGKLFWLLPSPCYWLPAVSLARIKPWKHG